MEALGLVLEAPLFPFQQQPLGIQIVSKFQKKIL